MAASASTRPIWPRRSPRAGTTSPSSVSRIGPCRIEPAGYRIVDVPFDGDPVRERHEFLMALHCEADRREFDLVESPLWAGNGAAVGSAARWPLVVRLETPFALIREMSGIEYNHAVKILIAAEQLQLVYATGIIGISEAVVRTVESTYHVPLSYHGRRVAVIPLGLALGGPYPVSTGRDAGSGGTRFLYIGRFEARKGVLELAEAFARVARQDATATLWLVGADNSAPTDSRPEPGKPTSRPCTISGARKSRKRVHFFGKVDDAAKNYLLSICDVLVAPSLYESFGLMYVEAMRAGKPVIGSNAGGIPEVVDDGKTGLLVPPGDALALADGNAPPGCRRRSHDSRSGARGCSVSSSGSASTTSAARPRTSTARSSMSGVVAPVGPPSQGPS